MVIKQYLVRICTPADETEYSHQMLETIIQDGLVNTNDTGVTAVVVSAEYIGDASVTFASK